MSYCNSCAKFLNTSNNEENKMPVGNEEDMKESSKWSTQEIQEELNDDSLNDNPFFLKPEAVPRPTAKQQNDTRPGYLGDTPQRQNDYNDRPFFNQDGSLIQDPLPNN